MMSNDNRGDGGAVMPTLKRGSSGPDVMRLQEKLKALSFDPGGIDGIFGPATDAAVRSFQASRALLVDGIVVQRMLTALGLGGAVPPAASLVIDNVMVDIVAQMFPGTPLGNIRTHLGHVLQALVEADLAEEPMALTALATIRVKSPGFKPISEFKSRFNTSPGGHPFDRYDYRQDLGNQGPPDGERFKGRGFIQLAGRTHSRASAPGSAWDSSWWRTRISPPIPRLQRAFSPRF